MSTADRVAVILDGEYVKKVLGRRLARFPTHSDVMAQVTRMLADASLLGLQLYRIFYHTAEPLAGTTTHPLDGKKIDFAATTVFSQNTQLIDKLELEPEPSFVVALTFADGSRGSVDLSRWIAPQPGTVDRD